MLAGSQLSSQFSLDVGVIGGGGRVGCPLALSFAHSGLRTLIYDVDPERVALLRQRKMPFIEEGADELLRQVTADGLLIVEDRPDRLADCRFVVLIVGTPVDEHLNPTFTSLLRTLESCRPHLRDGQVLILRSTLFPGTTAHIDRELKNHGLKIGVAFCPERVAQGYSIREFHELPQIISGFDPETVGAVRDLFGRFTSDLIELAPMEAELCKLMTNAWRYIQFATVNQFYMIASQHGLNFDRILHGCRFKYPRMAGMPGPGFAAGPCLVKDTMQLAAFSHNNFVLGHSAMLINEGLPAHLIELAKRRVDLSGLTAGVLGMAFKSESDDARDSLSYKLKKLLVLEARRVLQTDPYVRDPANRPLETVVAESDVLFVATPHKAYRALRIPSSKTVVDVWSCLPAQES